VLKSVLLASAVMISVPALAQDQVPSTSTQQTTPPTEQSVQRPALSQDSSTPQTATPDAQDPAAAQTQQPTTADQAQAAPAQPATGQPASAAAQVAQIVNQEFPTYDKNADGNLDKTEFGSWMVALKTASDPTTKPDDPATKSWVNGAFASADTDKSAQVSKDELTAYLSKSVSGD